MLSASKILIKRSSTPGSVPSANQLESGELALNLADKKIFFKNNQNGISFIDQSPYTLLENLSSVVFKIANNEVTGPYSGILGGYFNDVSGGGSTTINGENNDIVGDFALIGSGLNNTIGINGDYSAILGGKNNTLNHQESFIIGSNITSHLSGFTYVNNLSSLGKIYGDGSNLTGIVMGDTEATTLVRTQSASWGVGGTPQNLSFNEITKDLSLTYGNTVSLSSFGSGGDSLYLKLSGGTITNDLSVGGNLYGDGSNLTGIVAGDTVATTLVRSNSGFWESVYSTVQTNSSSNWDNSSVVSYIDNNFLPVSGGTLTGNLSVLGDLVYVDTSVAVVSTMYIDTNTILDPALRITQRGTGDVIRVEDSANPDSTPFIINSDGLVGVGTSSPNEELTVVGNISATGMFYGNGSNLTGIVAGDIVATTLVRSNSGYWESAYSTVSSLSSNWQTTFSASSAYVSSNPTGITGASALTKLLQITQAGYNSITPASDTLYIIVG